MKRDVNDTERTTLAAVKALRISMCEFSDQRNAAFMSAQMKKIWLFAQFRWYHRLSQLFILIVMMNPWEVMVVRVIGSDSVVRFCVSLRSGLIVSVSVKYLLAASAALRHKIAAFKSSTDALVTIITVVSVFVCGWFCTYAYALH